MPPAIIGSVIVAALTTTASVILAKKQAAKARRRARRAAKDAAGISDRVTPSGAPVNILYGRCGEYAEVVYASPSSTSAGYATEDKSAARRSRATDGRTGIGAINARDVEAEYKQFLLTQNVICVGQINAIKRLMVDDVLLPGNLEGTYIVEYSSIGDGYGVASPMASNWLPWGGQARRGADHKFTDLTYITAIWYQGITGNGKEPQYGGGIPTVYAIVEGRIVHTLRENEAGVVVVSEERSYSNNVANVLYDYLTSELYGPNLGEDRLDLESFYRAQEKFGTVVLDSSTPSSAARVDPGGAGGCWRRPGRANCWAECPAESLQCADWRRLFWHQISGGQPPGSAVAGASITG